MEGEGLSQLDSPRMQLLLVGTEERDFLFLRDLLTRAGDRQVGLDHARSIEEGLARMGQRTYDLLLCSYKPGENTALRLLHEIHKCGPSAPVIFLADHVDETAVAGAVQAGAADCLSKSGLDEASLSRAIRYAIEVYCKERQRQKAEDTVRKLWRAVEQSADLLVITDRSGVIEYVNPAFEQLTGYSREEVVGRTPRILKSGQQPSELYRQLWQTILAGDVFRGVLVNRKKNGETFIVEKAITPLRDGEGRITHFISNDRDITGRRKLEQQLQQAQKMDAIGKLAGGIAHDFNNLLMVISAYAELMLDSLATGHPLRKNAQEIMTASRRAADLTRQLLAFSRKQIQALRLLDLNEVIQDISKMLPRLIGEDVQLVFNPGQNLGRVRADTIQIEQVLMNLAVNARDAMPQGGTLAIETSQVLADELYLQRHSMVPPGEYVLLKVTDTGEGIPAEHMPHIFEPFYTTKPEGKGTGLGLATVYGIVKQSGGFVWAYSDPGFGTTFKIYLPCVQPEKEKDKMPLAEQIQPSGVFETCIRNWETLMLVEDEISVRQPAREFLTVSGYTVLEASNGEEALRVARNHPGPIHLLITDVVMPQLGGPQLAKRLAMERTQLKVLFISGYAESTILRQEADNPPAPLLQKPFGLKELANKIREVLQTEPIAAVAAASSSG